MKNRFNTVLVFAMTAVLSGCSLIAHAAEIPDSSKGTEITVYNQNFALVKDLRSLELKSGINQLKFTDVAAQIDPTSVHFKSLTAPNSINILEQNYQYDLISPDKILDKYLGKQITVRNQTDGVEKVVKGTLLSNQGGRVIQTADGLVLNPAGTVELPTLPEGLISKPTLLWMLDCDKAGTHDTEISYMTNGINWKADYVTVVNKTDDKADLSGWVTLDNQSGASYKNASLKLIAGDVHRVQEPTPQPLYMEDRVSALGGAAPQFTEKGFFEYHMYTLDRKTDLASNETKQLSLLTASDVTAKKVYVFEEPQDYPYNYSEKGEQKINVKLELVNSQANHLGMPLPKGKVRVYKMDEDGSLQFVGEDQIDHTPKDEKVRLYLGDAFDIVGERKRIDFKQVSNRVQDETYEISLRNHKDVPVTIAVVEHPTGDWEILSKNFDYVKKDSTTIEFNIPVQPNQEQKLTYRIMTKW